MNLTAGCCQKQRFHPWTRVPLAFAGPNTPAAVGAVTQLADLEELCSFLSHQRVFSMWLNGLVMMNIWEAKEVFMVGSLLLDQLRSNLKCHPRGPVQASLSWCCRNPIPAVRADLLTGINSNIPVTISVRVLRALIGLKGPEASTHTPIAHRLCLSPALSPQPLFELCCRCTCLWCYLSCAWSGILWVSGLTSLLDLGPLLLLWACLTWWLSPDLTRQKGGSRI